MIASWVIGSGGLLGSALAQRLPRDGSLLFAPHDRFHWNDRQRCCDQIAAAVDRFAAWSSSAEAWELYWAAGIGTMRSSAAEFIGETEALRQLLQRMGSNDGLRSRRGTVALASSAGAIYAGSRDWTITEQSVPAPTTAYAYAKLEHEAMLQAFAASTPGVGAVVLRLSTLYGLAQSQRKPQGLLSHIARSVVSGLPVQIYVPLDTVRDYIAAEDAAVDVVRAVRAAPRDHGFSMRIVASEQPTTISEIVSVFRRVARRPLRIVTGAITESALYARRVQFRSAASPRLAPTRNVSLLVGVAQVLDAERKRHARGSGSPAMT